MKMVQVPAKPQLERKIGLCVNTQSCRFAYRQSRKPRQRWKSLEIRLEFVQLPGYKQPMLTQWI